MARPAPIGLLVWAIATAGCGGGGSSTATPPGGNTPRPEHPRPDLERETFVNMNGLWDFAFDPDDVGLAKNWANRNDVWNKRILVPFAWDAPLSGVAPDPHGKYSVIDTIDPTTYRGVAWYRVRLPGNLPQAPGEDWWIVFGAVDFHADVFVDGALVAQHDGGYAPFAVDVSAAATTSHPTIVLRVKDDPEHGLRDQPVGKQGVVWYTRTSGIWQTVYLEARPPVFVKRLWPVARPKDKAVDVTVTLNRDANARVSLVATLHGAQVGQVEGETGGADAVTLRLPLSSVELWDADHPTLYGLEVRVDGGGQAPDIVHSYFGIDQVATGWIPGRSPQDTADPTAQAKAFFVNGKPRYLRCVLDQSYNPEGVYTAPSEQFIRNDLSAAKDRFGFNCIRVHVKTDEPLVYRLADELGLYVVYDIPSLDGKAKNTTGFPGRRFYERGMRSAILRDRMHPSVVSWVLFNENWGLDATGKAITGPQPIADNPDIQSWLRQMVTEAHSLDPYRPIEDNSAGGPGNLYEHLDTDVNSFHYYRDDTPGWRTFLAAQAAKTYPGSGASYVGGAVQDGAPWWISEFGNKNLLGANHSPSLYCNLYGMLNEIRRRPRLVGYDLTQLTDVEYEWGGLMAYDRTSKDLCVRHGVGLKDLTGDAFIGFDWLPDHTVTAGSSVDVPLFFSDWRADQGGALTLHLAWNDQAVPGSWPVAPSPYQDEAISASVAVPATAGETTLVAEVRDAAGDRICADRIAVMVQPPSAP